MTFGQQIRFGKSRSAKAAKQVRKDGGFNKVKSSASPQSCLPRCNPLKNSYLLGWLCFRSQLAKAPVAQLDRASVFGTEGWGFESLRVYFAALSYSPTLENTRFSDSVLRLSPPCGKLLWFVDRGAFNSFCIPSMSSSGRLSPIAIRRCVRF